MKAVILAGGRGTRISEESQLRPKPMVTVGDMPILWHVMKIYEAHGVRDFIVCLGYRSYAIKEFFANYALHAARAVTFDFSRGTVDYHDVGAEPWRITLVETGDATQTGGRIKRIRRWIEADDCFCLTYGDGLADIDVTAELAFHRQHGGLATVAVVAPPGRFGSMSIDGTRVTKFAEKPVETAAGINGGFFVLSPRVLEYIDGDDTVFEHQPLERLSADGQLFAYKHTGFWQPVDTLRERELLEKLWATAPPWKTW